MNLASCENSEINRAKEKTIMNLTNCETHKANTAKENKNSKRSGENVVNNLHLDTERTNKPEKRRKKENGIMSVREPLFIIYTDFIC